MAHANRERDALYSRLRSIESDLSSASAAISDVENKLAYIDSAMASFQADSQQFAGEATRQWDTLKKALTF